MLANDLCPAMVDFKKLILVDYFLEFQGPEKPRSRFVQLQLDVTTYFVFPCFIARESLDRTCVFIFLFCFL
jgi:hypothetical protein